MKFQCFSVFSKQESQEMKQTCPCFKQNILKTKSKHNSFGEYFSYLFVFVKKYISILDKMGQKVFLKFVKFVYLSKIFPS